MTKFDRDNMHTIRSNYRDYEWKWDMKVKRRTDNSHETSPWNDSSYLSS